MTNQLEMTPTFQSHDLASLSGKVLGWFNAIPDWSISLVARVGIAGLFWRSGQTKVDGWQITDSTRYLFEEEYALPLLPTEV